MPKDTRDARTSGAAARERGSARSTGAVSRGRQLPQRPRGHEPRDWYIYCVCVCVCVHGTRIGLAILRW